MLSGTPEAGVGRRVLNIGCGRLHVPGAINLDRTSRTNPDVVHDLDVRPWPFPSDAFHEVHARDVLEHLADTLGAIEELHRICADGAVIHLTVPHFSAAGAYTDPTHRRFFSRFTFDYFFEGHEFGFYSTCRLRPRVVEIIFQPRLLNKIVWRLANRFPRAYEERWAWIFPAWFVHAQLEVVKKAGDR